MIDDVLDYSGDNKATGKNVGDDLAELEKICAYLMHMALRTNSSLKLDRLSNFRVAA